MYHHPPLERRGTANLYDDDGSSSSNSTTSARKGGLTKKPPQDDDMVVMDPERAEEDGEGEGKVAGAGGDQHHHARNNNNNNNNRTTVVCKWMKTHRFNAFVSFGVFLVLVTVASGMVAIFNFQRNVELQEEALLLAEETGSFFSDQLDNAIIPLFSLAQFVAEIPQFRNLPNQIGQVGIDDDALPFLPGKKQYYRNITNVCDDPQLVERFNQIASTIKSQSNMDGILVNLQIAPDAVVCLIHPLNNTEDFEPPVFMDNTGAIGHDLLSDPERSFIARATIPSDDIVVAGPLRMAQCQDCHPTVEKAFIARLPIALPNHTIAIDGQYYPDKWGFAVAILNWNALVERSGIYEMFQQYGGEGNGEGTGWEFQLTRTDRTYDEDTGMTTENVSIKLLLVFGFCFFLCMLINISTTSKLFDISDKIYFFICPYRRPRSFVGGHSGSLRKLS